MKLTAKVKLQPTPEQYEALLNTLETANRACLAYYDIRERFNLSAQVVVRCISKVSDAYKVDKKTRRAFRLHGAIAYDARILRWYVDKQEASIWTTEGRERIPFVCGSRQLELLRNQRGESDLALVDGEFYLFAACDIEIPAPQDVDEFLGIDLGIVNIATDSDGQTFAGGHVNGLRNRYARLRARLQSKGTKSAKRLLKKRRHKESRFARNRGEYPALSLVARGEGR